MESMGQEMSSNTILGVAWQWIASVGWYLVGLGFVLLMASSYLQEKYNSWKSKKDEAEYSAKYHKDPDIVYQRLTAIEEVRNKMQEKYNEDAEFRKKKVEENKEKKRQELLKTEEKSSGNRLGGSTSDSKSRLLKQDYNPLMGNSSRGYRPPKRSCCGKGGCG
ncbi:selenoprotein S-like [Leptopilina heterotoma]|uniref:selenoprotein S-like n=1 Tax=Leptopilina heterotoma TaxID=63436 RepID=UPI001CAA18AF|nr:selenoprotein S-like [Leptopilina heterotoma]